MRDVLSWSLFLGRWAGVQVRLHVLFLLFAVFAIYFAAQDSGQGMLAYTFAGLGVLLLSVVLHEAAHCFAARAMGAGQRPLMMVLWPLGGLVHQCPSRDPSRELWLGMAGPLANLTACLFLAPLVVVLGHAGLLSLFNPLAPPVPVSGLSLGDGVSLAFWINWLLVVANLLPAYPLDGARMLRAALTPRFDYELAVVLTSRIAQVAAVLLCVVGVLLNQIYPFAWMPLVVFGIFLFFSAKQESDRGHQLPHEDAVFGYDFSQGYTSLERTFEPAAPPRRGPLRAWLEDRRAVKRRQRLEREREEDDRVDEILARLHETGFAGLTAEERALLNRVSARLRSRQQS